MTRGIKRAISLLLALLLTLSLFGALPAFATGEPQTRFAFGSLTRGETVYPTTDAPVELSLSGGAVFTAGDLHLHGGTSNAFYVSLVNSSSATRIRVTYTYTEGGAPVTETTEHALTPYSDVVQRPILAAPNMQNRTVSALQIAFAGDATPEGTVLLRSFFDLNTYLDESQQHWAAFSACHYNAESGTVEIAGEVDYAATVLFAGQSLALFSLESDEEFYLSRKTPIARAGMSLEFSFSVKVNSADDLFARYVVAAVDEQGAGTPLCTPTYPTFSVTAPERETGFKGFHTEALSTVLDCAPGVEMVDVYLDRLQAAQGEGILYVGEHAYYYFNEAYVTEIDRRVRNLTGIGTHVYLRFLIGGDANNVSFADYSDPGLGVVGKLPTVRGEDSERDLYAFTAFLAARYADDTVGRISGVVLGRSADRADLYSYADAADFGAYIKLYVDMLNLVAVTVRRSIPDARVVLPVSDSVWNDTLTPSFEQGNYPSTLFLPSLLSALKAQILEPQSFSVMLETSALPDRVSGAASALYGADRLGEFTALLRTYGAEAPFLVSDLFVSWIPNAAWSASTMKAAYLWHYAALTQNQNVTSFIVDFSPAEERGEESGAAALSYLARYVDTDKFDTAAATALTALGVTSLQELFPELGAAALRSRTVTTLSLSAAGYASGATPAGSYRFCDFTTATGTLGWYGGYGCSDLALRVSSGNHRSMVARLSGAGEYADIAYSFARPVDLSFAPLMCVDLAVEGAPGARYEVQLRLVGDADTVIASAIATEGQGGRLYLDLSDRGNALSTLRSIRITARPLDGNTEDFVLSVSTFDLESTELSGAELSERFGAILQSAAKSGDEPAEKRNYTVPIVVTVIVFLACVAIVIFLFIRRKSRRALRPGKTDNNVRKEG